MNARVAVVHIFNDYSAALNKAITLIGGIEGLNTPARNVTIKVGIFDPRQHHHACIETVGAIIEAFDLALHVYLAESDNYCGKALDRLERFKDLFSERVTPQSLSEDPNARVMPIAGEEAMPLGHVLFKPNVFISTHLLRTFERGSILKNLFGCTPEVKKSKYHKTDIFVNQLCDIFEAAGGIDLAVLDGTFLSHAASGKQVPTDVLIVGRDAVAVETVGAVIAGLKPEKMPVIQAFVQRGLGVGDMEQIEILGVSPEELAELKKARRQLNKLVDERPRSPGISGTIDCLTQEGWMDALRTAMEVAAELQKRGVKNATKEMVDTTMKRRLGKTLEREKTGATWAYRRKQE